MPDLRLPLTDRNIASLPLALEGQYRARDTELAGFFLLIGTRTKSFMVQADLRLDGARRSVRIKVGEPADLTAREARARARTLLAAIANGVDPRAEQRSPNQPKSGSAPTLRQAWERYRETHLVRKGRAESTRRHYADHIERLLKDWLELPLTVLGDEPRRVADRHDDLSRENGPAIANSAMRSLRAVYNHARKTCRALPAENPTFAVDWNPERRRDTGMGLRDLPAWFERVASIDNPIRREFHLLLLLSGSRPEAFKRVRVQDVDLSARRVHLSRPKGGEARAFDIPLSHAMVASIVRLRRLAPLIYPENARTWLFPSDAPSGHMEEHKEKRSILSHWGNDLRQSYRTLGQAAGLSEMDMRLLMNHALLDVNAGYITRSKLMTDHLRQQQEKLSTLILGRVVGRGTRPSTMLSRWLRSTSRAHLRELISAHPDAVRTAQGPRSAMRKLEIQATRCQNQNLGPEMLDAPSRRPVRSASR